MNAPARLRSVALLGALLATLSLVAACGGDKKPGEKPPAKAPAAAAEKRGQIEAPLKTDKGVDVATKTITIGTLNDESSPAAVIGKPFANGKRILAAQINAGDSGLLPAGWKVALVEKDHSYDPQKSVQAFNALKEDILFIATSFGTPATMPLVPHLEKTGIVAFPASLSSKMAANAYTPPIGAGYNNEVARAVDWIVESAGGAANVKIGLVYQGDDYGADGLAGFDKAVAHHKLTVAAKESVSATQKQMVGVVTKLKEAGATHVILTTLPTQAAAMIGTGAKMQFGPVWVGNTPSWIDPFFSGKLLPTAVFAKFYWISGLPYWGEDVPGMKDFMAAYDKHGKELGPPDFYTLVSYIQGRAAIEAANRAMKKGDITRAGFLNALQTLTKYDAGGMIEPINLTKVPYVTSTKTRILKPDFEKKSWIVAAPYAEPKSK